MGKPQRQYALYDGMILEKIFYGRARHLLVKKGEKGFVFEIDGRTFDSLTAAARYVCGDQTREVSGPQFWNAPLAK